MAKKRTQAQEIVNVRPIWQASPEREAAADALRDFLVGRPDGEELPWLLIESATGIKMDAGGKNLVRIALRRLKRPYVAERGTGIRLSSAALALGISRSKFSRLDGALEIADKTQRELSSRHLAQMSGEEQRKMIMLAGFFGMVRSIARETSVEMRMVRESA